MKNKYFILLMFLILQINVFSQAVGTPFTPFLIPKGLVVSKTGRIWMDKNLGAKRVATSPRDSLAVGFYYQWGRGSDGHQEFLSAPFYRSGNYYAQNNGYPYLNGIYEINMLGYLGGSYGKTGLPNYVQISSSDTPNHNAFIAINYGNDPSTVAFNTQYHAQFNWRYPPNDNLWQGIDGINNPCPTNFRVPTSAEWQAEIGTWPPPDYDNYTVNEVAFNSPLRLPYTSYRDTNGQFKSFNQNSNPAYFNDKYGYYWSSDTYEYITRSGSTNIITHKDSKFLNFWDSGYSEGVIDFSIAHFARGKAMPVRCILDEFIRPYQLTLGDYSIYSDYSNWHP
jgi:hypothetical protein